MKFNFARLHFMLESGDLWISIELPDVVFLQMFTYESYVERSGSTWECK